MRNASEVRTSPEWSDRGIGFRGSLVTSAASKTVIESALVLEVTASSEVSVKAHDDRFEESGRPADQAPTRQIVWRWKQAD